MILYNNNFLQHNMPRGTCTIRSEHAIIYHFPPFHTLLTCYVRPRWENPTNNEYGIPSAMETPTTSFVVTFSNLFKVDRRRNEVRGCRHALLPAATLTSESFLLPQQDQRRIVMTSLFSLCDVVRWCYGQRTTDWTSKVYSCIICLTRSTNSGGIHA